MASAADLKFLHHLQRVRLRNFKSRSGTRIINLLVPSWFSKFVSERAALYHELRKPGTSAADLKFLHHLPRIPLRNFKSRSGTRIIHLLVPSWFSKFVSERAALYH